MALIKCKECGTEVSSKAESCPKCGAKVKAKGMGCGTLIALVFFIGIIALAHSPSKNTGSSSISSSSSPPSPDPKNEAMAQLEMNKFSWSKGGFDSVMMVNVTFVNKGKRDVKDIELTCEHSSNSGTRIDSNKRVIYEVVSTGKSKTMNEFNMGFIHSQAVKTNCSVTDLVVQ